MVLQENLCVIVRTRILWCSLFTMRAGLRGLPITTKGSVNRSGNRRGTRGERDVSEWAKEGREKKVMAFKEVKYLKVVCGEGEAVRMRLGLWLISKHSNYKKNFEQSQNNSTIRKSFSNIWLHASSQFIELFIN